MKQNNDFTSTHKLDFNSAPFNSPITNRSNLKRFKIGTCIGIYGITHDGYQIHSINNTELNNGHFDDVLEWFEFSCKRDGATLLFTNVDNKRLKKHLIEKRGFVDVGSDNVKKTYNVLLS